MRLIFVTTLALFAAQAFAANGTMKGDGSAEKPFQIEDYEDLKAIGKGSYLYSSNYIVTKDIDASASKKDNCYKDGDCYGFRTIGKNKDAVDSTVFWGSIDGGGHTIKNLHINNGYASGAGFIKTLIGSVVNLNFDSLDVSGDIRDAGGVAAALVGTIRNVHVTNGNIKGSDRVGGIVGKAINGKGYAPVEGYEDMVPVLRNVSFQGKVSGHQQVGGVAGIIGVDVDSLVADVDISLIDKSSEVGGIAGYNYGSIRNSHSSGKVTVTGRDVHGVGGLVGENSKGSISQCYSSMNVEGARSVGGLVGYNDGIIFASYALGSVEMYEHDSGDDYLTAANEAGGLVGCNHGKIYVSYALGSVIGSEDVGGLVGDNDYGEIYSSYAQGRVTGRRNVGGLVGSNGGVIATSYAANTVEEDTSSSYNKIFGGFVGLNEKSVVNSYWDAELSKLDTSAGGTGMSTQKMMTMSSFAGWDTLGYWMYDRCEEGQCEIKNWDDGCYCKKAFVKFWAIDEGKSYPYLNKNLDLIDYQWSEYLRSVDNPEQPPVRIQNQTLAKSRSFGAKFDGGLVALRFEIPTAGAVKFSLVDMQGRVVKSADLGRRATGSHFETLNVENIARGRYVGVLRVNGKSNGNVVLQK